MKEYLVVWKIDVLANTHEQAVIEALEIMRDKGSCATIFDVYQSPKTIDAEDIC